MGERIGWNMSSNGWCRGAHIVLVDGHPAEQIIKTAKRWRADLIVMGVARPHLIQTIPVGSLYHKATGYAPCSMLVIRASDECPHRRRRMHMLDSCDTRIFPLGMKRVAYLCVGSSLGWSWSEFR